VRIAVMGMTGVGKSSFIKTLIPDADIAIGGDMNSRKLLNGRV
jgi:putative ribosome biogenesis GTPase RsgA